MPTSRPVQTADKLSDILTYHTDIEELGDEMETWGESIPDALQSSDKASEIDEAKDTLHEAAKELEESCDALKAILEKLTPPANTLGILDSMVSYTEHKMYKGYNAPRWVRLSNPTAAIDAMHDFVENRVGSVEDAKLYTLVGEDLDNFKHHMGEIDDALRDLENVSFPGMYG